MMTVSALQSKSFKVRGIGRYTTKETVTAKLTFSYWGMWGVIFSMANGKSKGVADSTRRDELPS